MPERSDDQPEGFEACFRGLKACQSSLPERHKGLPDEPKGLQEEPDGLPGGRWTTVQLYRRTDIQTNK